MKTNYYYLILFLLSLFIFILFRIPYRQYIYSNSIFDFYIADTAPNFIAVFLFVFLKKWQKKNIPNKLLTISTFLGLTFYELFIQTHVYKGAVIDRLDILATFIASIIAYFICQYIDTKNSYLIDNQ